MPYEVRKIDGPRRFGVFRHDGKLVGTSETRQNAYKHIAHREKHEKSFKDEVKEILKGK